MSADLERLAGLIREDGHNGVANMVNMVVWISRRLGVRETYAEPQPQPETQSVLGTVRVVKGVGVNDQRGLVLLEILKNSPDPLSTHDLSVVSGYDYNEVRQGLSQYRQNSTVLALRGRERSMLWMYNPDQEPK